MPAATRTRPKTKAKPKIVYFRHFANGAISGYDEAFLQEAFASLQLPPHLKALQKKKHPLEEIAIQILKGHLQPSTAPAEVNTVEIDEDMVEEVLRVERELAAERKLEALEAARERLLAGEDVDISALTSDSPYMAARPAVLTPDPVEPRMPGAMTDAGAGFPGSGWAGDPGDGAAWLPPGIEAPFGDVPPTNVVSPDRPMAAEPAGGTTTSRRGPRAKKE